MVKQTPKLISTLLNDEQSLQKLQPTTKTSEVEGEPLPELTEEESEHVKERAIQAARLAKKQKEHEAAYWDRIYNPPKVTTEKLREQVLERSTHFDAQGLNPGYVSETGYELDEWNEPIFKLLCLYFTDNPLFETPEKVDPFFNTKHYLERKFSLNKGIALLGPTGCGKSILLKMFTDNPKQPYTYTPCSVAVLNYENSETTAEGGAIIDNLCFASEIKLSRYARNGAGGKAFDDLGNEDIPAVLFKKQINLMRKVIERRVDMGITVAKLTHVSTNLNGPGVGTNYGERVRSRFNELFNIIRFSPNAPDRRKQMRTEEVEPEFE